MPIPLPGVSDVGVIFDKLFNRLHLKVEECGPCRAPEFLGSIWLDLADGTQRLVEEEARKFTNPQEVHSTWTAAALTRIMEIWKEEHEGRKITRNHFERLQQRLAFMEDAPTLEKLRFLLALLTSNRRLIRPVAQTLVEAASHPDFTPPSARAHTGKAVAELECDEEDRGDGYTMTCRISVMGRDRIGLLTSRRASGPRLRAAVQAICTFDIFSIFQLLSVSIRILDRQIRAYEDLAPSLESAIERKRPLLVRFKIILPPNNTAPAFEPERYLCIVDGSRRGTMNGSARIELQPVLSVDSGKEAPFASQGEYYCLSSRPVQEIEAQWAQAQHASVQLRLRSRTTGLFKNQWLASPVVPTRTVLPG